MQVSDVRNFKDERQTIMTKYCSIIISVLFLVICPSILGQRSKQIETAKKTETVEKVEIIDSANDFSDKGLPEAKIIGSNPSDQLAVSLAKELSNYENDSLPLLIATLQKAGFYVIDENQKILYKPTVGKGMGLAFYDYEVVGMYKLSRRGIITSVGKLSDLIGKEFAEPTRTKLGEYMLSDLRTAGDSDNITKRFWARLIIELSKNFPEPVDLMTASPADAQINIIQASLWERRLIGDLIGFANQQSSINLLNRPKDRSSLSTNYGGINLQNASYIKPYPKSDPCNYADEETTEIDAAATIITTIHGKILDFIAAGEKLPVGKLSGNLEKIGKGIGYANLALSWAKLIAAASQMKGTIKVETPLPLIRTKSSSAFGERRLLTGKFEIAVNKLRQLNCMRTTINMTTGLDFSMPSSGPLTEKPVSWELGGEVSFKGQKSSQTGEYDQVVYLLPVDGANRDHHKQETDANGESKIYLEGNKQKRNLTNEKVVPLQKKATIRADVALKSMKDTKQDAADIGGGALGILTGGPLGILSGLPELGFRMKIPVVAVSVPIRDWTPCSEDWGGTFSYTREFSQTIIVKSNRTSNGNSTGDGIRKISQFDQAEITLHPRKPDEIPSKDPIPADIVLRGKHSNIFEGRRDGDPCCGKNSGAFDTTFRSGVEDIYNDFAKNLVGVEYRGSERDFSLSLSFGSDAIKVRREDFYEILSTSCPLEYGSAKSEQYDLSTYLQGVLPEGRYGERFANSEGELLQGEKVLVAPGGAKTTWKWALARCGK